MTWKSFRGRGEILREVIATANTRRDGRLPLDVAGVDETFRDELDLLAVLQLRWHTHLAGAVERELASQPLDLPAAVALAWTRTADALPGVRLVLDAYREHPIDDAMAAAMARATTKEHAMLAVMAGRAGLAGVGQESAVAPLGAELEQQARAMHGGVPVLRVRSGAGARPARSLLGRLRSAFAA